MKKTLTLILGVVFMFNMLLAQQTDAPRSHARMKSTKTLTTNKGILAISGSIASLNNYVPGSTMILNFELNFATTDQEYWDGMTMTFPAGMTPIVTGTSDTISTRTGCSSATGQLNPISGQTISWGEITTATGCGFLNTGTYTFSVGVTIGAITGAQDIAFNVLGDGWGSTPHNVTGTVTVNQAVPNDVGVSAIGVSAFYQPGATVTPTVTVLNVGTDVQSFDVSLVFNDGTTDVYTQTQNVANLAAGANQQVSFPTWTSVAGNFTATATTLLTGDANAANDVKTMNFLVTSAFTAYAWNALDPASTLPEGPVTILIPAGQVASIATDATDFIAGADFVNATWYGAQYSTGSSNIYTIDKTTGVKTLVGASGVSITGLAYDVTTTTLFASVYANSANSLYAINTGNGVGTLVAPVNTAGLVIGIACNNNGDLYGVTLDDSLVMINKTSGAVTTIGALGVDINYAQDIAYDRDNNKLYGTLYTNTGILAEINTTTGAATTLATFGAELTGFAIPYAFTLPDDDVLVQSITAIPGGCGLSNAIPVQVRVYNNGNLPQSNIPVYYTINGGTQVTGTVAGPIQPAGYADYTFTTNADLSAFGTYAITACTNLSGDAITANDCSTINVTNIQPSAIPYTMGFETTENISGWKVEDVNADDYLWSFIQEQTLARTGTGLAIYEYNADEDANDWMFTTCLNLNAGTDYQLDFWYRVGDWQGTTYPEKLKVAIGTTQNATGMTQVIEDLGTLNNIVYAQSSSTFTVPATGTYYIGWQAYSDADMFYIALDDISVTVASSVEENDNASSIKVYPNPTKTQLNISSTENIETIKVYNTMGQLIVDNIVEGTFYTLNTSTLPYGVYFVNIETAGGISVKRFVIAE